MKREQRNWTKMQSAYDSGMTWRDIQTKFDVCSATLAWARKNGYLHCRSMSDASKLSWSSGRQDPAVYRTPEHRKIMSRFGGLRTRAGRCSHIKYTKSDGTVVDLQGSWEFKFAEFLDHNKIEWERNRVGYKYVFDGKGSNYFPDFFLPSLNVYVEVKGYETDKDRAKWKQFPFKLLIVKKEEIQDLDKWWKTFSTV